MLAGFYMLHNQSKQVAVSKLQSTCKTLVTLDNQGCFSSNFAVDISYVAASQ
jgi:hypothetical protein